MHVIFELLVVDVGTHSTMTPKTRRKPQNDLHTEHKHWH